MLFIFIGILILEYLTLSMKTTPYLDSEMLNLYHF